jgi:hypothetical protein
MSTRALKKQTDQLFEHKSTVQADKWRQPTAGQDPLQNNLVKAVRIIPIPALGTSSLSQTVRINKNSTHH